jgi:hypothetical protein
MDLESIREWFKTTILGIVLLGAFGSILAFYILKLLGWVVNKYFSSLLRRFFLPIFRYHVLHKLVALSFADTPSVKSVIHFIYLAIELTISSLFLVAALSVTCIYFIVKGAVLSYGSFLLVVISFLTFYMWLRDISGFFGAFMVSIRKDIATIYKNKVKNVDSLSQIDNEADKQAGLE